MSNAARGLIWGLTFTILGAGAAVGLVATGAVNSPQRGWGDTATQPADAPKRSPDVEKHLHEAMQGVIRHGLKAPKPRTPGAIRVATYNIENLFDKEQVSDEPGRTPTPAKPPEHRQAAADAIRAVDADVLMVQEIESKEVLTKFRDEYLKGLGYDYIASIDAGDRRGIEQSVLSRFPIVKESNWTELPLGTNHPDKLGKRPNPDAGKPMKMTRSPLLATIEVPADKTGTGKPYRLSVLVIHQKSGPFHSYWREAESVKVVALAKELTDADPNARVIIAGDFNAKPEEQSVQTYISAGFVDPFAGVDPKDATYHTHVSGRAIDHLLLSPSAAKDLVKSSGFVLGTLQRKEGLDWRNTPAPTGYASDHYPTVIDLLPTGK